MRESQRRLVELDTLTAQRVGIDTITMFSIKNTYNFFKIYRKPFLEEKQIIEGVCQALRCTEDEFQSRSRNRDVVEARQIAHYLLRKHTKLSLAAIGHKVGAVDHATVIWSIKSVEQLLEFDKSFQNKFETVTNHLYSQLDHE